MIKIEIRKIELSKIWKFQSSFFYIFVTLYAHFYILSWQVQQRIIARCRKLLQIFHTDSYIDRDGELGR